MRAAARRERGLELKELDDYHKALDDFGRAEVLLRQNPFALGIGLSILNDGIELAEHAGSSGDSQAWRMRGEALAAKLLERADYKRGLHEVAVFYTVTGQTERATEVAQGLLQLGGANATFTNAAVAFAKGPASELESTLGQHQHEPEAAICLGYVLAAKGQEGKEHAMALFHDLQQRDIQIGLKAFALNIALISGEDGQAKMAANALLESGAASQEWRWYEYIINYHADKFDKDRLDQLAGPFGASRCMVHFAIGMRALAHEDRPTAMTQFEKTVTTGRAGWHDHLWAQAFLERMKEDETWPDPAE